MHLNSWSLRRYSEFNVNANHCLFCLSTNSWACFEGFVLINGFFTRRPLGTTPLLRHCRRKVMLFLHCTIFLALRRSYDAQVAKVGCPPRIRSFIIRKKKKLFLGYQSYIILPNISASAFVSGNRAQNDVTIAGLHEEPVVNSYQLKVNTLWDKKSKQALYWIKVDSNYVDEIKYDTAIKTSNHFNKKINNDT